MTIELEPDRVEPAMRRAARKISQETTIPGFRRGKAPYSVVLQMFGREAILEETIEELLQDVYKEALENEGIEPFAKGELVDVKYDPLVLTMRVPVAPVVELGDYRALRLEAPSIEVTEEDVEKAVEETRDRFATWVPAERGAEWGDQLLLEYTYADEERDESEEEHAHSEEIVLDKTQEHGGLVPGMADQLLGMKAGESKTFDITFPEDWHNDELAGRTRTMTVTVKEVKERELPPLDDLPAIVGDYDSLDDLKAAARKQLFEQKRAEQEDQLFNKALDIFIEGATLEFPDVLVEQEIDQILSEQDAMWRRQGLSLQQYFQILNIDPNSYREDLREDAITRVKRSLVMSKLVELEKLTVEGSEVDQAVAESSVGPDGLPDDEARLIYSSPIGREFLESRLLGDKLRQRVVAIVKGEAPALEETTEEPAAHSEETSEPAGAATASVGGEEEN